MSTFFIKEPILFKGVFSKFGDSRGFLSAIDLRRVGVPVNYDDFHYQLLTYTKNSHTFRGFHFQNKPFEQNKVIFIHSGSIIDIVFPINLKAPDEIKIFDLCAGDILYVPKGHAHGFISVSDGVVLQYLMDNSFSEEHYTGINGRNVATLFQEDCLLSDKDSNLPHNFTIERLLLEEFSKWLSTI